MCCVQGERQVERDYLITGYKFIPLSQSYHSRSLVITRLFTTQSARAANDILSRYTESIGFTALMLLLGLEICL